MPLVGDNDIETVRQEAALWLQASGHPNIVPVLDAEVYDGQVVIASEYIAGEIVYRIPSLSLPDLKHTATPESLLQVEAAHLFVDRATAACRPLRSRLRTRL